LSQSAQILLAFKARSFDARHLTETQAGWVKDAHKVRFAKIYYSYHPLYGESVKIIRPFGENCIIQTQDGKRIGVPKWMTDKAKCLQIKHSSIPYCSHSALTELQSLLACIKDRI
jgi:hypothetical protein